MNKLLESALYYRKMGFSVIPVKKNKRPLIKWEKYQIEISEEKEINEWWGKWPNANIGIVTGKISGVDVVDVDSQEGLSALNEFLPDSLQTPIVKTPSGGWHYYFAYKKGLVNATRLITDCDVRTTGGYIVAPPSTNGTGKKWEWDSEFRIDRVSLSDIPSMLFDILSSTNINKNIVASYIEGGSPQTVHTLSTDVHMFKEGSRDTQLFHLANHLVKGKMPIDNIKKYLHFFASRCNPPYPTKDIPIKIKSALKRSEDHEINISQEIKEFVLSTSGHFLSTEIHNSLQLSTRQEKKTCSAALSRLVEDGTIERYGNKNGCFRRIEIEETEIDIFNVDLTPMPIRYPLDLHEYFRTMPKNIIVVAGSQDAGKSAFMLNAALLNMNRGYEVKYFSSEMGGTELRDRIQNFEIPIEDWKAIKFRELKESFQDQIDPDGINIIDYLEIQDNFWLVSSMLAKIYERLKKGIALVALQKDFKADLGRGGSFSLEKPRLYITLTNNPPEGGIAKIVKCKNWVRSDVNPNHRVCHFSIVAGCQIRANTRWETEYKKEI